MSKQPNEHERFLTLVQSHQRALSKICWTYSRSQHDRDDIMQEIVGRLWSAFASYDSTRSFSTWMYRVALNVAIDYQRRQRRWTRESATLDVNVAEIQSENSTQLRDLHERLSLLPDADRALLLLFLEGHTYREIGEVIGISETNVGTRLNRIKTALRQSSEKSERDSAGA